MERKVQQNIIRTINQHRKYFVKIPKHFQAFISKDKYQLLVVTLRGNSKNSPIQHNPEKKSKFEFHILIILANFYLYAIFKKKCISYSQFLVILLFWAIIIILVFAFTNFSNFLTGSLVYVSVCLVTFFVSDFLFFSWGLLVLRPENRKLWLRRRGWGEDEDAEDSMYLLDMNRFLSRN